MPTGVEEILAGLVATVSQAAAASPVTNESAAQGAFAADQTAQMSCEPNLIPELAEGGSEADAECKSYDFNGEADPSELRPVTGDRPQPVAPPQHARPSVHKLPSPADLADPVAPAAPASAVDETHPAIAAAKELLDARATLEILPNTTLVSPSFGDVVFPILSGTPVPSFLPSLVFDKEGVAEDVLGLAPPQDRPDMPLALDDEGNPASVMDRVVDVAEQASGTDQIVKRATNLLKATAMNVDELDDPQSLERDRVLARDGFLLAWELFVFLLTNRRKTPTPTIRPLPPSSAPAVKPRSPVDLQQPSRAQTIRNRVQGEMRKRNEPTNDPTVHRLGRHGEPGGLGRGHQKTVRGVFEGMQVHVEAGSKNNNGVQSMKIVVEDITKIPKGSRQEHEAWRRVLREAGLIDKGFDAGHGVGRAIADLRVLFNFFNEPPAGNRIAKNWGAEQLIREKLEATNRTVPAKLEYTAQFRDAEGNPIVEKCRLTLIGLDGQVLVDVVVDLMTNKPVNLLDTLAN